MGIGKEISEARKVAQVPRLSRGMDWYRLHFVRRFSIYISYFLAKAYIPPNLITMAMGLAALCGAACLVLDNLWWNIAGAFLGQLWLILDCVDGEVARLRNKTSVFGVYLDDLMHTIVNPSFILALGLHVYLKESSYVNLAAMILIYSVWHWKRLVTRITRTKLKSAGGLETTSSVRTSQNKANRTMFYYLRAILPHCVSDVDSMLIVSVVVIFDHVTEYDIVKSVLYLYTTLSVLFIAALILRDMKRVYRGT